MGIKQSLDKYCQDELETMMSFSDYRIPFVCSKCGSRKIKYSLSLSEPGVDAHECQNCWAIMWRPR